jgi:hypothetical protein
LPRIVATESVMRHLVFQDLRPKGILYSKQHLKRLVAEEKFPQPIKGLARENVWTEEAIDNYIADGMAAASKQTKSA